MTRSLPVVKILQANKNPYHNYNTYWLEVTFHLVVYMFVQKAAKPLHIVVHFTRIYPKHTETSLETTFVVGFGVPMEKFEKHHL